MKNTLRNIFLIAIVFLSSQKTAAQCFETESILVDACGGLEGFNEMVRIKVGNAPLNTSNLTISWPNLSWQGTIQNATTAALTATLNTAVVNAGGCGQIIEPPGGVIPANATVIICTSYNLDPVANSFGQLNQDIYIVYQNNGTASSGHFANVGAGIRTLTINFGACTDTVSYDRSQLTGGNGATVNFTPSGIASYTNSGCNAPVSPFLVNAGPPTITVCPGETITLNGTAQGQQSVGWTAPSGTFSAAANLSTTYTVASIATGNITITLTATNSCNVAITDTIILTVNSAITANFANTLSICNGDTVPTLNNTSPNGIIGSWNPAIISNTAGGNYIFTPNAGQCAVGMALVVTVNTPIIANFANTLSICSGDAVPTLNNTSPNGIIGSWNPAIISNTAGGNYVFTPNAGQCAVGMTLVVTVNSPIAANFANTLSICSGDAVPTLNNTSPNGIIGSWNPATISNTTGGNYVFTPNAGQCAVGMTLVVTVNTPIIANFASTLSICNGDAVPTLNNTSPNGIIGSWNPAIISNTAGGNYVFTPNAGQCAVGMTLVVTVNTPIIANFVSTLSICSGDAVPTLSNTSPNGIIGSWNPAIISNTTGGNYVFTPNAGQCALGMTLVVTVNSPIAANFANTLSICSGDAVPTLSNTSPNGIIGSWNSAIISNTTGGNYVFTPNAGQCALGMTLVVTVNSPIAANFANTLSICNGDAVPTLNNTSPNGIIGSWNPAIISNTTGGNYVFTPNAGQCAIGMTLAVTVNAPTVPVASFSYQTPICSNSNPILPIPGTGFSTGGFYASAGLSINSTTGEIDIASSATGNFTVTYTILPNPATCNAGNSYNFPITINPVSLPTAIVGSNTLCIGENTVFSNATPNGIWSTNNSNIATIDNSGTVTGIAAGTTTITYMVNNVGCDASVSKTITVYAIPTPTLTGGYLCIDNATNAIISSVNLDSGLSNLQYSFSWTVDGNALPTTTGQHLATEPGVYEVTAINLISGCSATASATVGISSLAIATATVGQDFENNQHITISVTGGSGQYQFQINDGPFQDSNVFTNISQGEYDITVKDKHDCGIIHLLVYALNYPHFFTPNGDGFHDVWNISGLPGQSNLIYIFDRYGKLLKAIKPGDTGGWNGTYNGNPLPSTDYWFKLMYQDRNNKSKEFSAHFSLKR